MRVPTETSEVLGASTPIAGGVDEIEAIAEFLRRLVGDTKLYANHAARAQHGLATSRGDAVSKLQRKLDERLLPGASLVQQSAEAAKKGTTQYASEVDRIHASAKVVARNVRNGLDTIRTAARTLEDIESKLRVRVLLDWRTPPPGRMPTPQLDSRAADKSEAERQAIKNQIGQSHQMIWSRAAAEWKDALDHLAKERRNWNTLIDERRHAERRFVRTLRGSELGKLISAGRVASIPDLPRAVAMTITGERWAARKHGTAEAVEELLTGGQSPAAIAAAWRALGLEVADVEKLPPETLAGLTKTPGLPARAQDAACRALLKLALKSPERVHRLMGFRPGELSLADFTTEVSRLRDAWEDAKLASADIPGKPTVHLTGFGRHDGAVTAAISLGDLDTAERVAVNVSGMNSDMTSIGNGVHAAESLLRAALQENGEQSYAIVTWIGYRSPSATEVRFQDRADSGARELSRYIDGTFAARAASGNPMKGLAVYAHSYGSTTASLALMQIQHKIDTFVAYGSAGIPKEVTVAKMNVASVFSTAARGDNVAWAGFTGTDRQQPQHMRGVTEFSSEAHGDSKATTAHDMFTDGYSGSFWNWGGKVGYLTTGTRSVTTMGKLFATGAL